MDMPHKKIRALRMASTLALMGLSFWQVSMPAVAASTHYTIQFSGATATGDLPTGSFDYDATAPSFANFVVTWAGLSFDLTSAANNPVVVPGPTTVCGASGAAVSFLLLSKDDCLVEEQLAPKKWEFDLFADDLVNFAFVGGGGTRNMFFSAQTSESFIDAEECDFSHCGEGSWLISATVPESIPEPGTLGLIGIGLAGLAASRRRKQ